MKDGGELEKPEANSSSAVLLVHVLSYNARGVPGMARSLMKKYTGLVHGRWATV